MKESKMTEDRDTQTRGFEHAFRELRSALAETNNPGGAVQAIAQGSIYALNYSTAENASPDARLGSKIDAYIRVLSQEVCCQLLLAAGEGRLDSPEVDTLIAGAGGALDWAEHARDEQDGQGLIEAIRAAESATGTTLRMRTEE